MDSISYVFLGYANHSVALLVVSPAIPVRGMPYLLETRDIRGYFLVGILSALFMVYLDIIIDPVALRSSKWFWVRSTGILRMVIRRVSLGSGITENRCSSA